MIWALFDFKTAKEEWFQIAELLYLKKVKPYAEFQIFHLKTDKSDRSEKDLKKKFEAEQLINKLSKDDYIILFDEAGKKMDSMAFSELIRTVNISGKKRGVFIIGGAYGVADEIKKRADKTISLSDMTMNHLVAEIVLLEQFYRAHTILNRIPYHNI